MDQENLIRQKNNAYWERNQLVAALSKLFPSHLAKHPESDIDWEDDWRTIVVIYIPSEYQFNKSPRNDTRITLHQLGDDADGYYQLTWHIHDNEVGYFDHLIYQNIKNTTPAFSEFIWDGHSTEEKYRRLRTLRGGKNGRQILS